MNNEYTHIAIVLDKSGSMGSTLTDTIGEWAVADAIKMRAAGGCDCMTCTCQPDD